MESVLQSKKRDPPETIWPDVPSIGPALRGATKRNQHQRSMSTKTVNTQEPADGPTVDDDPAKTRRAATEYMIIHSSGDALWDVYSGEKPSHYQVFAYNALSHWQCTCPDHENRHCECKHIRRVQMELGLRDIPETPNHTYPDVEVMIDSRVRVHKQRQQKEMA